MAKLIQSELTKQEIYNIRNGVGCQLQNEKGICLDIVGIYQYETTRNNSDSKDTAAISTTLITVDGEHHTTLSNTVARCAESLVETFGMPGKDNVISVKVATRKSKGGREFFILEAI